MKQNRGITLIALVVTIVVLLILAGVTISIVFGDNGVISKAQEAALQTKIESVKEKVALEMVDLETDSTLTGNPLTAETIIEHFENLDWVGSATKESEDIVRIISTDSVIVDIKFTPHDGYELIDQGLDDGEPYPTMTLEQLPTEGIAGEKIKIKVTASVEQTKETTGITTIKNVTTGETKDYTEGGVVFEVLTNGEYTFKATTNKGKTKTAKINVNIAEAGVIGITIEPTTPRNTTKTGTQNGIEAGPIKVSISYGEIELTNEDKYQYRIGTEGEWQTSNSNQITVDATENTIVVARYYDGKNSIGVQNYSIKNVDNVAPNSFTPTVTETTTDSITVSASTTDTASEGAGESIAGILRYEYSIDGSSWQTTNTLQNLSDGTSYTVHVKAIDKAGNETITTVIGETESNNYLVDMVSIGDYVAYDAGTWENTVATPTTNATFGGYTAGTNKGTGISGTASGWRVLNKSGSGSTGTVTLISAGSPAYGYYGGNSSSNQSDMINALDEFCKNTFTSTYTILGRNISENDYTVSANIGLSSIGVPYWLSSGDNFYIYSGKGTYFGNGYVFYDRDDDQGPYYWLIGHKVYCYSEYSVSSQYYTLNFVDSKGDKYSKSYRSDFSRTRLDGRPYYLYEEADKYNKPAGALLHTWLENSGWVYNLSDTIEYGTYSIATYGIRPVITLKAGIKTNESADTEFLGQTCWAIR